MRKLLIIYFLGIVNSYAQQDASTLDELLQLAEDANYNEIQMDECSYELSPHHLEIIAEGSTQTTTRTYTIYLPNNFLEQEDICGHLFNFQGFLTNIQGSLESGQTILLFMDHSQSSIQKLIFETDNSGIFVVEEPNNFKRYRKFKIY